MTRINKYRGIETDTGNVINMDEVSDYISLRWDSSSINIFLKSFHVLGNYVTGLYGFSCSISSFRELL
jgi:hypothetical protein